MIHLGSRYAHAQCATVSASYSALRHARAHLCLLRLPPHLRRDWARPCHICAGTGLIAATSAPGLGSALPHLHRDWAHRLHCPAVLTTHFGGARRLRHRHDADWLGGLARGDGRGTDGRGRAQHRAEPAAAPAAGEVGDAHVPPPPPPLLLLMWREGMAGLHDWLQCRLRVGERLAGRADFHRGHAPPRKRVGAERGERHAYCSPSCRRPYSMRGATTTARQTTYGVRHAACFVQRATRTIRRVCGV